MTEERKKILEMLAEGKITAEDAERLLDKIEAGASSSQRPPRKPGDPGKLKWLLVHIDGNDGDTVNVRVPLSLVRTGIKLGAILPVGACDRMQARGIDLSELSKLADDELMEALADLQVDVNGGGGETVRVYCE